MGTWKYLGSLFGAVVQACLEQLHHQASRQGHLFCEKLFFFKESFSITHDNIKEVILQIEGLSK